MTGILHIFRDLKGELVPEIAASGAASGRSPGSRASAFCVPPSQI